MFIKYLSTVPTAIFLTLAVLLHSGSVDVLCASLQEEKDDESFLLVQMQAEAFSTQVEKKRPEQRLRPGQEPVRSPAASRHAPKNEKADDDKGEVGNYFAPGQFQQLEDSEPLSKPSFEEMSAGVTLTESGAAHEVDAGESGSPEPRPGSGVQVPDVRIPEIRDSGLPGAQRPRIDVPEVKPVRPVSPPSVQLPGQDRPERKPAVPDLPPVDSGQAHQDPYVHSLDEQHAEYSNQYHGYADSYSNNWDHYADEGYYYGDYYDYYGYESDYGGYYDGYYGDFGHQQHEQKGLPYGTVRELDDIMRSGEAQTFRGWEGQHEYPIQGDRPWYERMYGQ